MASTGNALKETEKAFKQFLIPHYQKSPEEVHLLIRSIMQSFSENSSELSEKAQALKDKLGKTFVAIYNSLLLATSHFYSERITSEEVAQTLADMHLDAKLVEYYAVQFEKFQAYMESADGISQSGLTQQNKLLDFRWEMREPVFDTEADIPRSSLVIGELIYLDTVVGSIKRFKFLVPIELTEQIARDLEIALSSTKTLMEEFN
jgi:hypothetical protein